VHIILSVAGQQSNGVRVFLRFSRPCSSLAGGNSLWCLGALRSNSPAGSRHLHHPDLGCSPLVAARWIFIHCGARRVHGQLSYTALKTFQQCRFHYHLCYHRGLPSRPRPAAQSSRALHGALHLFHRQLLHDHKESAGLFSTETASLATLLAHFQGYADNPLRPLTEQQVQEGKGVLTRYWEAHRGKFPPPYLLEEKFKVHVGPFLLAGRIDRVDATAAGYEILDYKLSQRGVVAPDPLQLDVYQLGFQAVSGQAAQRVSFYYLRTGQKETVEAEAPAAAPGAGAGAVSGPKPGASLSAPRRV
jgi:RecB family exonuclease